MALHSFAVRPGAASSVAAALVVSVAFAVFLAGLVSVVVALASVPHSALRNWFQFCPFSVPASLAALYLVLHSAMVSALAGAARNKVATARPVSVASRWMSMAFLRCCRPYYVPDKSIALNERLRQMLKYCREVKKTRSLRQGDEIVADCSLTLGPAAFRLRFGRRSCRRDTRRPTQRCWLSHRTRPRPTRRSVSC
ncbi:exported hypothetical protein [Mesorhizobium metallidurans STM 2683]|uniref:Uncharacterized protein n=1 Tax=Mesorhizobium metallidurans STM 2683 TaxID=1297569 RepID=M5EKI7_9HYPH|nr:exported hypothetical protein [Mesorhizobium metallidurans STM 2683]